MNINSKAALLTGVANVALETSATLADRYLSGKITLDEVYAHGAELSEAAVLAAYNQGEPVVVTFSATEAEKPTSGTNRAIADVIGLDEPLIIFEGLDNEGEQFLSSSSSKQIGDTPIDMSAEQSPAFIPAWKAAAFLADQLRGLAADTLERAEGLAEAVRNGTVSPADAAEVAANATSQVEDIFDWSAGFTLAQAKLSQMQDFVAATWQWAAGLQAGFENGSVPVQDLGDLAAARSEHIVEVVGVNPDGDPIDG